MRLREGSREYARKWPSVCLNAHWFWSLEDARRKIEVWREYYNEARPHSALQWMTPAEFARQCTDRAGSARPEEPEFSS